MSVVVVGECKRADAGGIVLPGCHDGVLDYALGVDPLSVRSTAIEIVRPYAPRRGPWCVAQALALYEFVRELAYIPDPIGLETFVQAPAVTLAARGGNCEAKSLLFTSLARSVGIPTRMVHVQVGTTAHLLNEVFVGAYDLCGVGNELAAMGAPPALVATYDRQPLYFEGIGDERWLIADTAACAYAGDVADLFAMGFMQWVWTGAAWHWQWSMARYFSDGSDRT